MIRPDHLGDALLSRPAVELLRQSLPGAEITLLVGSWSLPSWHGAPVRLATFPFPGFRREVGAKAWAPYRDLLALAVRLRRERYDAAVVMRPDHWWGALAAALAGIPIRVGYRVPAVAPLLTLGLALPAPEPTARSALRLARVLARELGGSAVAVDQTPVFEPGAPARRDARAWLEAHCAGRTPRVAIHPGAGARVKCWPAARWGAVARALAQDAEVILTAASDEDAMLAAIQRHLDAPAPAAIGLPWATLGALYEELDLVLGMDSGPLHLAAAVGTPTIRLYGPTDPAVWGPAGPLERHAIVQGTLPCVPCGDLVTPPCGSLADPPCLASVAPEQVVAEARARLGACSVVPA